MQQYKFCRKGQVDFAAIQEAARTNAWIGVEGTVPKGQLNDVIYEHQNNRQDTASIEYLNREVKEGSQRVTSRTDLQRGAQAGGPQNDTATAASLLANEADTMDADYLESYFNGYKKMGADMAVMLQQNLGEQFFIRPSAKEDQKLLGKEEIMGAVDVTIKTALEKSDVVESQRLINSIIQLTNLMNAAPQQLAGMRLGDITRDAIGKLRLDRDPEEILPRQEEQQLPQGQLPPGNQLPPELAPEQPAPAQEAVVEGF